jgi:hypothetical protein
MWKKGVMFWGHVVDSMCVQMDDVVELMTKSLRTAAT